MAHDILFQTGGIEIILGSALVAGILIYSLLFFHHKDMFRIKGKTIRMQKPVALADNSVEREAAFGVDENLVPLEAFLRRKAYRNTSIKTGESFFDDSDMTSEYYLIVIYDKKSNTPLLSARYYYDKTTISQCLMGDESAISENPDSNNPLNIDAFADGSIFLADRLSGNISCSIYRRNRDYIFLLLYAEILQHNQDRKFILMARSEKGEKLLSKYLRLGHHTIGSTKHKGKKHWILLGDLKRGYSPLKLPVLYRILLAAKNHSFG